MRCTEAWRGLGSAGGLVLLAAGLTACGKPAGPASGLQPSRTPATATAPSASASPSAAPAVVAARTQAPSTPSMRLPPPATPRSLKDLQLQFARRLVAAHPETSYTTRAPDRLQAIPVLEVELHADGSVRRIDVLRRPTTGDQATALAIAAVRRAAPYGDVSRLPRPWKVVETFLFDDQLRFKPRTLDVE